MISPFYLPSEASDVWKLLIDCKRCRARFAVIGAAYFCPCCGDNAVERVFDASLERIRIGVENIDVIRHAFERTGARDKGEILIQQLLESSVEDCVTAFQRLSDVLYAERCPRTVAPRSAFQRLDEGSALWKESIGIGYEDILTPYELGILRIFYQRRHLLSHTDGVVDEDYLHKSGDSAYRVGQRVVVKACDVLRMECLIRRLADAIRRAIAVN